MDASIPIVDFRGIAARVEDRSIPAWLALAAALLIKPQAAAFVPVLAVWQFYRLGGRALLAIAVGGAADRVVRSGPTARFPISRV